MKTPHSNKNRTKRSYYIHYGGLLFIFLANFDELNGRHFHFIAVQSLLRLRKLKFKQNETKGIFYLLLVVHFVKNLSNYLKFEIDNLHKLFYFAARIILMV